MEGAYGRPTQVHGVPLEERAIDSKGNRLPWGLEWHEDHTNSRGQRRHIEEKGPFGKPTRRRGTSRTRTATPSKRENPIVDGFEQAFSFSVAQSSPAPRQQLQQQSTPGTPSSTLSQLHGAGEDTLHTSTQQHQQAPALTGRYPTQVMIFGYSSETQWAALDFYEKSSLGMICEDYAREPASKAKKFPNSYNSPHAGRRPLTKTERAVSFRYDGGEHWVKVTFDSIEAADRAIEYSPTKIYGHLVYAQLYTGTGPERDAPIRLEDDGHEQEARLMDERELRLRASGQTQEPKSLSFATRTPVSSSNFDAGDPFALSANETKDDRAVSSGISYPSLSSLKQGAEYLTGSSGKSSTFSHGAQDAGDGKSAAAKELEQKTEGKMQRFPNLPRTFLRPASEAFLPQPTWWDRQVQWLTAWGLIPGDVIGTGMPLTATGEADLQRASVYWRFFYWLDSVIGSDVCGLKDE